MKNLKHFALYLHVPFCTKKCNYCAFKSSQLKSGEIGAWFSGVEEGASKLENLGVGWRPSLKTVYIGGGTPTILGLQEWQRVIKILKSRFDMSSCQEFSVEANPESLKDFHINIWKQSGVTRVSLGVQSLIDDELKFLGRAHDAATAVKAIKRLAGQFALSADLIFGTKGQTLRSWDFSLRSLLSEGVKHISTYQLTVEDGTTFGKSPPVLPDGYPFYRYAQWLLPREGLRQYEIASFAAPGRECRHNLSYWRQDDVIALGPSAWGYLNGVRYKNSDGFDAVPEVVETLSDEERGIEGAILALRTWDGLDVADFEHKFGKELLERIKAKLKDVPEDCVVFSPVKIRLTTRGMRVANRIWQELI